MDRIEEQNTCAAVVWHTELLGRASGIDLAWFAGLVQLSAGAELTKGPSATPPLTRTHLILPPPRPRHNHEHSTILQSDRPIQVQPHVRSFNRSTTYLPGLELTDISLCLQQS